MLAHLTKLGEPVLEHSLIAYTVRVLFAGANKDRRGMRSTDAHV